MTGWDTRAQIGLRAPRGINTNINPTHGVVFHYAGGGTHRRSAHSGCRALWRAYQDWHLHPTNANNYNDIAYNLGVCVHDIILEGRSTRGRARVRGGANGNATVNGNRYSICAIWGANDGAPPDSLKRAYLAARAFLRSQGGAGNGTAGHRDMQSTGCPGQPIYNWIRAGAPAPGSTPPPTTPPPSPPQEVDPLMAISGNEDQVLAKIARAVTREQLANRITGDQSTLGSLVSFGHQRSHQTRQTVTDRVSLADGREQTPRWLWREAWNQAAQGRSAVRDQVIPTLLSIDEKMTALVASQAGEGTGQIMERIDGHAAEVKAQLGAMADDEDRRHAETLDRLEAARAERADIQELVTQVGSGELAADEVVRLIGERLAAPAGDS